MYDQIEMCSLGTEDISSLSDLGMYIEYAFIITSTNTASTFYLGLWSLLSCQADAQFHPFLGQPHGLLTTLPQNMPRVGGDAVVESKICRREKNQRNWLQSTGL